MILNKILYITILCSSMLYSVVLNTDKDLYQFGEKIQLEFKQMDKHNKDWIGIYKDGSDSIWANVVKWKWTNDISNGNMEFNDLPEGKYDIRAFYNNSFKVEAVKKIEVKNGGVVKNAKITTDKNEYNINESIIASYDEMSGSQRDWIAIYPKGSDNDWENVIQWGWINGEKRGKHKFKPLAIGEYDVRVFFNNTYNTEAKHSFKVIEDNVPDRIVYEDAEKGLNPGWVHYQGRNQLSLTSGANNSIHGIRAYYRNGYYLDLHHPAKKLKILDINVRMGVSSHMGNFGVYIKTKKGNKRILFSTYMNHYGPRRNKRVMFPFLSSNGYCHNHPAPTDYFYTTRRGNYEHYRIDIDKTLKILEPDNELLSILLFTTAGSDFDNISLATK